MGKVAYFEAGDIEFAADYSRGKNRLGIFIRGMGIVINESHWMQFFNNPDQRWQTLKELADKAVLDHEGDYANDEAEWLHEARERQRDVAWAMGCQ